MRSRLRSSTAISLTLPPMVVGDVVSPPVNQTLPVITGTVQVGQVLSVSTGTWTNSPTGFGYQWYRNGAAIAGSINQTRTLTAADQDAVMYCEVTASNAGGGTIARSDNTSAVIAATLPLPTNTVAPAITGTSGIGNTLTVSNGTWTNMSGGTYAYQWRRNGVNITGETAYQYVQTKADAGQDISCRVSATNTGGTTPAVSNVVKFYLALVDLGLTPLTSIAGQSWLGTLTGFDSASTVTATADDGTVLTVTGNQVSGTFATMHGVNIALTETNPGAAAPHTTNLAFTVASGALAHRTPPAFFFNTAIFPAALTYNPNGSTPTARWGTTYSTATFRPTGTQYYVSTTGNDTTGDGSSGNPWATLQKAHDTAAAGSRVMVAPGRYLPVAITKNISFEATTPDSVYVGTFVKNSDVSSWGTVANSRQTITLASGYIYGFVDLAETYSEPELRGYPKVAQYSSTAATDVATRQSHGRPGIYVNASGSVLGAASGRDLTNTFDTTILAWKNSSTNRPFSIAAGLSVYSYGIFWVGGKERTIGVSGGAATFIMEKGGCLGQGSDGGANTDQVIKCYGTFITKNSCAIGSNIAQQDVMDFDSQGGVCGVYDNFVIGQGGNAAGDQGSTTHQIKYGILATNCVLFDCQTMIADLGPNFAGWFGVKVLYGAFNSSGGFTRLFATSNDIHFADVTFSGPTPSTWDYYVDPGCYAYDYDRSLASRVKGAGTGLTIDYYNQADPTGDAIFAQIVVDPAYLYQDAAGTQPVTASGQAVARIQDPSNPAQYWTVPYGAYTYIDDGVHKRLDTNTIGRLALNGRTTPIGPADIIVGVKSTDTSCALFGTEQSSIHKFGEIFTSASFPTNSNFCAASTAAYKVDNGSTLTTKTAMKAAVLNGNPHVVSIENIDLTHSIWTRIAFGGASGSNQGATYDFTGSIYGLIIQRHSGNATFLNANKTTVANASGVTLP